MSTNVSTAKALLAVIKAHGGITYRVTDGEMPQQGFAVSIPGHEERFPFYLSEEDLKRYIAKHEQALTEPGHYLGAWLDNGVWVLDVTRVVGGEQTAKDLGVAWKQETIFDLSRGIQICIPQWMTYAPEAA